MYARLDLTVVWVEPIPEVFLQLQRHLRQYPKQTAVQALVSSGDGERVTFNVASNNGESSSMLAPGGHLESWPDVAFTRQIELETTSMATLLDRDDSTLPPRSALVMDTQGSELMILTGATSVLNRFLYVKVEAPDFEAYVGCPSADDLSAFMAAQGFRLTGRFPGPEVTRGQGRYYDLVFTRSVSTRSHRPI